MTNWDTLLAMIWKRTQTLNRKILVISTKNISLFMSFKNSHWLIFSSRFSYFDNFHLKTFFFFFHIHMIYKHPVTMTITSLETLLKYLILWVNSANFQGHRLTLHADLPYSDLPSNLPQFHLSCCLSRNTTDKTRLHSVMKKSCLSYHVYLPVFALINSILDCCYFCPLHYLLHFSG